MLPTLVGLGFFGGCISGLTDLGGAIFVISLLLYIPPLLGVGNVDSKEVAAITIVQVVTASASGALHHWQHRCVSFRLVGYVGAGMVVGALGGGILSAYVSNRLILILLAAMASLATAMIVLPRDSSWEDRSTVSTNTLEFYRVAAVLTGLLVGFLGGMVGAAGGTASC